MARLSPPGPKLGPYGRIVEILFIAGAVAFVVAPLWVGAVLMAASVALIRPNPKS